MVVSVVSVWLLGSFRFHRFVFVVSVVSLVQFHFVRYGRFILLVPLVPFRSFRLAVSGFSRMYCRLRKISYTAVYCTQFTWENNCIYNSYCSFIQRHKHEDNVLLLYFTVTCFFLCKI